MDRPPSQTESHDDSGPNPPAEQTRWRDRLSSRIVLSSLLALLCMLCMIGWTLWLSWQLEGAAAAINDTGSLRMRANRIGIELLQSASNSHERTQQELVAQGDTLLRLAQGVPSRPLFLPDRPQVREQFAEVSRQWQQTLRPLVEAALRSGDPQPYLKALSGFVAEADVLVGMIETDNSGKTTLLRLFQGVLIGVASVGTLTMIYLLYLWIILPVMQLQAGLKRMAARDFAVRLPVETRDEFGAVARGFNRMAAELQSLYGELEARVREKTVRLATQNRELAALYDMAAFLNQPTDVDTLCRGFLQRVQREFEADGGSIRVMDPKGEKLHIVVSEGLSEALEDSEHCMKLNACFCGKAVTQGVVVIRDFRTTSLPSPPGCAKEGFRSLAVFRIVTQREVLGSFSLHFRQDTVVPAEEAQLLETLGQLLGVALDNYRLSAKARQLAVAEERSLMAQSLHDSLAQALNFLNLQVQMLEDATTRRDWGRVVDTLPLLKMGVDESYQDVRELLSNFRAKLAQTDLRMAAGDTFNRFQRQCGIAVDWDMNEQDGPPLPPEQQLQVLFILQEALSNVRKHAQATQVRVRIHNERDFDLLIEDNGRGYDAAQLAANSEGHIGLHIMQERASRMHAQLQISSTPGAGTRIHLHLPKTERQTT